LPPAEPAGIGRKAMSSIDIPSHQLLERILSL